VENCFGAAGQPLTIPGRVLIGEGALTKLCRSLRQGSFSYLMTVLNTKKKYNKQIIPLENVTIGSIKDEGELRNGWLTKTPTKSFAGCAKSERMNPISKSAADFLSQSGKTASDDEICTCSSSSPGQKCGFVVRGPCSEKRFLLPSQSSKPVRICDFCDDPLSTGAMATCQPTRSHSLSLKSPL
uniref:Pleckstrin homology domain containing, family F (with FYVE domain) member 2 n=1 Tax=Jaculus jaculus TaxID=51337 RepID=A0A8C5KDB7_JACJA